MKPLQLSEFTKEQLIKRVKTANSMTGLLIGIIIIQFAAGIYLTIQQGFSVFIIIPIAFIPLVIANIINLKKIKEEIARRK